MRMHVAPARDHMKTLSVAVHSASRGLVVSQAMQRTLLRWTRMAHSSRRQTSQMRTTCDWLSVRVARKRLSKLHFISVTPALSSGEMSCALLLLLLLLLVLSEPEM